MSHEPVEPVVAVSRRIELTGRQVTRPKSATPPTRIVEVRSRVVQRREAILGILAAAYSRDQTGRVGVELDL